MSVAARMAAMGFMPNFVVCLKSERRASKIGLAKVFAL